MSGRTGTRNRNSFYLRVLYVQRAGAGHVPRPARDVGRGTAVPELSGSGSRCITYVLPNAGTENTSFVPAIVVPGTHEVFVTSVNVSEVTVSGKLHPSWNQRVYTDAARSVFIAP